MPPSQPATPRCCRRRPSLLSFLKYARNLPIAANQPGSPTTSNQKIVLGNPSADLDSIISAIVFSYLSSSSTRPTNGQNSKTYIPVVNLPDVLDGRELRRLRPEFGAALFLATAPFKSGSVCSNNYPKEAEQGKNRDQFIVELLDQHVLTSGQLSKRRRREREETEKRKDTGISTGGREDGGPVVDTTLVDWNALPYKRKDHPGRGSVDGLDDILDLQITGCIDHHADEGFVPAEAEPRVIEVGPGSCTSLIVRELRARGLWESPLALPEDKAGRNSGPPSEGVEGRSAEESELEGKVQAAKLALAAILIDTTNLTAKGKVTDVDRTAVSFLEEIITGNEDTSGAPTDDKWDRVAFFEEIQRTKQNSLDLLNIYEILGRDYKEWSERISHQGTEIKLGIASVVKPISWLVDRVRKEQESEDGEESEKNGQQLLNTFLSKLLEFSQCRGLGVVAVMTTFTSEMDRSFRRELLVWAIDDSCIKPITEFAEQARQELKLKEYDIAKLTGNGEGDNEGLRQPGKWWVWRQEDISKSRKQVAPLLRAAINGKKDEKL